MDEDDDFIIEELIAATSSVERELGFAFTSATSSIEFQSEYNRQSQTENDLIFDDDPFSLPMPYFHCTGEDSSNSPFHASSYIRYGFASSSFNKNCMVDTLFGQKISEETVSTSEVLPILFQRARTNIQLLDMAVRDGAKPMVNRTFLQSRLEVTSLLFVVWKLSKAALVDEEIVRKGLDALRTLVDTIGKFSIQNFAHTAHCIAGNSSKSAEYHLFHGYLEWKFLTVAIIINMTKYQTDSTDIAKECQQIIHDLIQLSVAKYNRLKRVDLLYRTPFSCTCVKELWLLVQLVFESVLIGDHTCVNSFWGYFNCSLKMLQSSAEIHVNEIPSTRNSNGQQTFNWPEFSVWLLSSVTKLQGFSQHGLFTGPRSSRVNENFEMLNAMLRDLIATDPIEDALRTQLFIAMPVMCEWWPPKTDILLVLWEYFHKKLNSSFFLHGSAPSALAVMSGSVVEYLNNLRHSIEAPSVNPNDTSFSMFTYMFGRVLTKLAVSDKAQINKIFGRITSKFSAPKLMALNETGIYNVTTLFLTIGLTTHLKDTARPLQTILLQMTLSKLPANRQVTLVKGHMAMIMLFSRNQIPTGSYIAKLLEQLGAIEHDRVCLPTSKILADGFVDIFESYTSFGLGQQLLIGPWLVKYLSASQYSEHQRILACINATIAKISSTRFSLTPDETNHANDMLKLIYQVFVPYAVQTFAKSEASRDIAELAANLCLNGDNVRDIAFNSKLLLKMFTDVNGVNMQNLAAFLVIILTAGGDSLTDETLIIAKWIQCCMCANNANDDFKLLTNIVVSTNEFRAVFVADVSEILNAKEPLCHFFSQVGRTYETSDFNKRIVVADQIHQYLASFSSYAAGLLENPDNTVKVMSMISIIMFHCAKIVYIKGRNSCFFNTIMFKFVLPNHVLTGRPQEPHLVSAIHKVWHMLVMGIEKLDFDSDQHLITILTNLVEKWLPQFKSLPAKNNIAKPFLSCLKKCQPSMITFVFTKITNAFISLQRRQPHGLADMVLAIYLDILSDLMKQDSHHIEALLQCSCLVLIEHAMMIDDGAPTKNAIIDIFTNLSSCSALPNSAAIRSILIANLKLATDKHLAYFSNYYFRFVTRFAQINASLVDELLDHLRNTIGNVELMRGAGRDGNLRNSLHKLEQVVLSTQLT